MTLTEADSQGGRSNEIRQMLMGYSGTRSLMETIHNVIKYRQEKGKQRNNKSILASKHNEEYKESPKGYSLLTQADRVAELQTQGKKTII